MNIASNLKRLRRESGLTQTQLAEQSGVSQQLISQIERGVNLSTKELPALARALGVPVHEIDQSYSLPTSPAVAERVPLVSWVSAGHLLEQSAVMPPDVEQWLNVGDLPSGNWIALRVEGDSMDRVAPDGSAILVDRNESSVLDGKFYVFALDGTATFKRFRKDPDRLQPFSTNPDHASIPVSDGLHVFGRVRKVITDL